MKNILVTGASGFIGSAFINYAKKQADPDIRLILLTSKPIEGFQCVLHNGYTFTRDSFQELERVDVLVHLGAFVGRSREEADSAEKNYTTIRNTEHLLKNLPNVPDRIICLSSTAVYGYDGINVRTIYQSSGTRCSEETPIAPKRTYGLAKLFCERLILEYAAEKKCSACVLRLGPTYGKGMDKGCFLGAMFQCAISKKQFCLFAHPKMLVNYNFKEDTAAAIYRAALAETLPQIINMVSPKSYTALEVCETMKRIVPDFCYEVVKQDTYYGTDRLFDSSRRETYLGREDYSLEEGLRKWLCEYGECRDGRGDL